MASTSKQRSDYISQVRGKAKAFVQAVDDLRALSHQHTATDIANDLTEADFTGENEAFTKADILAVLTTLGNIETMMAAGNATNLYKVN